MLIGRSSFLYSALSLLVHSSNNDRASDDDDMHVAINDPRRYTSSVSSLTADSSIDDGDGKILQITSSYDDEDVYDDHYRSFSTWFRQKILQEVNDDPTLAGPFIRLAFHDAATLEVLPAGITIPTTTSNEIYVGNNLNGILFRVDHNLPLIPTAPTDIAISSSSLSSSSDLSDAVSTRTDTTRFGGPNGSVKYELDRRENRAIREPLQLIESMLDEYNHGDTNKSKDNAINNKIGDVHTATATKISLADAIALSGAAAVEAVGGPHIPIKMGRIDSPIADNEQRFVSLRSTTKRSLVDRTLPSPGLDSMGLRLYFCTRYTFGLTEEEMVALCGIHGLGRHVSLLNMSKSCLKDLSRECLENAPTILPFVTLSVDTFNNEYFDALLRWNNNEVELGEVAFIPTDVALVVDPGLQRHVRKFANDKDLYSRVFTRAYQKLVDTTVTTSQVY